MSTAKKWFLGMVIFAFASAISFFQINSYWADQHHFNGGWLAIGIVLGSVAVFCLTKVIRNSNKGGGDSTF